MEFLTNTDVTEIIKAMIGQSGRTGETLAPFVTEAAKACVQADRILSGLPDITVTVSCGIGAAGKRRDPEEALREWLKQRAD